MSRSTTSKASCATSSPTVKAAFRSHELQEQLRFLTEERDRLRLDLDAERNRVRRLKAANDEVSGRLEAVMVTLKDMMPAVPG